MYAYFDVPGGFSSIPVGAGPEELHARTRRLLDGQMADDPDVQRRLMREAHAVSRTLLAMGALYAGATVRVIDDELSMATLVVAAEEFAWGDDARVAAEGAMQTTVAARGKGWTGRVLDLNCGSAAVVAGQRTYRLPDELIASGGVRHLSFAELQAFVPVPDQPSLPVPTVLTVTFSTPSLRHWDTYMPPVVRMLRSMEICPNEKPTGQATTASG